MSLAEASESQLTKEGITEINLSWGSKRGKHRINKLKVLNGYILLNLNQTRLDLHFLCVTQSR